MLKTVIKILLPLLILGAAIGCATTLVKSRPKPPKQERQVQAYLVQAMPVEKKSHRIDVRAKGTVTAARRLQVQPQVTGRLRSVSDSAIPGGIVKKGDVLARIDATDYRQNLNESQTGLEDAKARLAQEQGQQIIAQRELELFQQTQESNEQQSSLDDTSLALRQPQLKIAKVAVQAAETRLERAKTNLSRTTLKAPFNALVLSESMENGQLVTPQSVLATIVGTDAFWIRASVPMSQLSRIAIPGFNSKEALGSEVTVEIDAGEQKSSRKGHVLRLLGELDQVGRMAQIMVQVDDPLLLESENKEKGMPLLLGGYVDILFAGSQEMQLVQIPRQAIHNGDEVWVYANDSTLEIRTIHVMATFEDYVLVSSGIEEGELLITSQIGSPVSGMQLRRLEESSTSAAKGGDK